jgi:hypothetical protein
VYRALASYASGQDPECVAQLCFSDASASTHPFQPQAGEKRAAPRRRVLLSALLVNHEFNTIFRCQVRDVSDRGARLNIPDCFLVPAGFWLIALSSGVAYEAIPAWRRFPSVGVSLGEPINLDEPTSRIGGKLRSVWLSAVR